MLETDQWEDVVGTTREEEDVELELVVTGSGVLVLWARQSVKDGLH